MSQAMSRALDRFRKIYTLSVFLFYFSALGCEGADWHANTFFDAVEQDWMTFRKCFRARNTIWDTKLKPAIRGSDLSYHLPRFGITR